VERRQKRHSLIYFDTGVGNGRVSEDCEDGFKVTIMYFTVANTLIFQKVLNSESLLL